ncbi:MAG: hypothetical protein M3297_11465 [Thermoproteota archaeon]|nr:hypothetical protein [Thermoproteota archaeon]
MLEEQHHGPFAFLAFHPVADKPIVDYVQQGTLSSDSRNIMTLFTLDKEARVATQLDKKSLIGVGVDFDTSSHRAYDLVQALFENQAAPPLPGIAFFARFTIESDVVYASLQGLKEVTEVSNRLRKLFSLADQAWRTSQAKGRDFADDLAVLLEQEKLPFIRTGQTSLRQWLIRAYRLVLEHGSDIVSAIGTIGGLVGG